jgi:outer membrane lipoprotein-sorting protein
MKNFYLAIAMLALFALGCKLPDFLRQSNSTEPAATSNSSTSPTTMSGEETAPSSDARADVVRASKKFIDQPFFSATMEGEGKTPMQIDLSYEKPDRFHMTSRQTSASGNVNVETIIIGQDMYMKTGERWQKMPGTLGKTVPQIRQFFDEKGLESLKDVTYVGEDTVEGRDAYVYSYRNELGKGMAAYPFTSKIWVRQADGLPAKIEVTYEGGDLKSLTIVYDYERTVSIKPPVN